MMNCLLCRRPLTTDLTLQELLELRPARFTAICALCTARFRPIDPATACPGCGRAEQRGLCNDCLAWQHRNRITGQPGLLQHRGLFAYNDAMKAYIEQYKGQGDYRLRGAFQAVIAKAIPKGTLVPLPSEPQHFAARGFDPVQGLFDQLPLHPWLLKQNTAKPQAQKDRAERLATPQSFTVTVTPQRWRHVKRIVLLDDLYTTGRTLYHARAALIAAGYQGEIRSFSLIR